MVTIKATKKPVKGKSKPPVKKVPEIDWEEVKNESIYISRKQKKYIMDFGAGVNQKTFNKAVVKLIESHEGYVRAYDNLYLMYQNLLNTAKRDNRLLIDVKTSIGNALKAEVLFESSFFVRKHADIKKLRRGEYNYFVNQDDISINRFPDDEDEDEDQDN